MLEGNNDARSKRASERQSNCDCEFHISYLHRDGGAVYGRAGLSVRGAAGGTGTGVDGSVPCAGAGGGA
jgi:hypothetical protein